MIGLLIMGVVIFGGDFFDVVLRQSEQIAQMKLSPGSYDFMLRSSTLMAPNGKPLLPATGCPSSYPPSPCSTGDTAGPEPDE